MAYRSHLNLNTFTTDIEKSRVKCTPLECFCDYASGTYHRFGQMRDGEVPSEKNQERIENPASRCGYPCGHFFDKAVDEWPPVFPSIYDTKRNGDR